jgi:hypothetical protein
MREICMRVRYAGGLQGRHLSSFEHRGIPRALLRDSPFCSVCVWFDVCVRGPWRGPGRAFEFRLLYFFIYFFIFHILQSTRILKSNEEFSLTLK